MERRKSRRYCLRARAFCWWKHADGEAKVTPCSTRDISYRGAFIVSEFLLPSPGAHIEVDVYLPPVGPAARSVQLHGEGTVLRVSPAGTDQPGFAAEVLFHTESSDVTLILGPNSIQ